MGLLLFILLVILVATFGFWDTLAAILGAALLIVLVIIIGVAILGVAVVMAMRRHRLR